MARMLVDDMSSAWDPEQYKDEFKSAVMGLVAKKVKAGKTETVIEPQEESPAYADNVIDLTELLQRSLKGKSGGKSAQDAPAKSARKAAPQSAKTAARKTAAKTASKPAAKATAKAATKSAAKSASRTRKAA